MGDTNSIAMIGWDDNKRTYRIVRAISNGNTADDSKGVTAIATWRFVGTDFIQLHVVHEKENDVLLDLTIKMRRRK